MVARNYSIAESKRPHVKPVVHGPGENEKKAKLTSHEGRRCDHPVPVRDNNGEMSPNDWTTNTQTQSALALSTHQQNYFHLSLSMSQLKSSQSKSHAAVRFCRRNGTQPHGYCRSCAQALQVGSSHCERDSPSKQPQSIVTWMWSTCKPSAVSSSARVNPAMPVGRTRTLNPS